MMGLWKQAKRDKTLKNKAEGITAASSEVWPSKDDLGAKGEDPSSIVMPGSGDKSKENYKLRLTTHHLIDKLIELSNFVLCSSNFPLWTK